MRAETAANPLRGDDQIGLLELGEDLGNVLDRHALQFGEIAGTRWRHVAPRVDQKQQAMQPVLETCRDVRHQQQLRLLQSEIGLLDPFDKGAIQQAGGGPMVC